MYMRDGLHISGLGKVRYLKLLGRGVCRKIGGQNDRRYNNYFCSNIVANYGVISGLAPLDN